VAADALSPEAVAVHLRGRLGRPYLYRQRCDSTQRLLDPATDPEGAVAVCDEQTAGRGRYGRAWEAPAGTALLCSIVLHPPAERAIPELTLVGALAAAEAVEAATGLSAQIKWPNDVMLNRRKVAGVLGELRERGVVLGIGINVNQRREQLPTETRTPAASLYTVTGRRYDRAELLGSLLVRLERLYDTWRHGGLADLYVELGPRDFLRGRHVRVDGYAGLAVGIDRQGRLELAVEHGRSVVVETGDVEYER
jgi:BirA family biotin operon repressor/biotin-[acetyl-CoA-carboxylase] ligase